MPNISYDWIKEAAQVTQAPSDDDIEKAFMDLALGFITQKAGNLLQDPYKLGFEVVYTDDDNTKMAGIFAFRISNVLLSVPCFFMNGDVKGTELLYQHNVKLFRPLNKDWTEHLINKLGSNANEGTLQSKPETDKLRSGMRLERLADPYLSKRASTETKDAWKEVFDELTKHATVSDIKPAPVLRDFLLSCDDGVMEKLAHAIDMSFDFAEQLVELPEETYMPTRTNEEILVKKASTPLPPPDDIIVFLDGFERIKSASEKDVKEAYASGLDLLDKRTDLKPVMEVSEIQLQQINTPGFFEVICTDNSIRKAFCGYEWDMYRGLTVYNTKERGAPLRVIFDENKVLTSPAAALGTPDDENGDVQYQYNDKFVDVPVSGSNYFAVHTGGGLISDPFHVSSSKKREDEDVHDLRITFRYNDSEKVAYVNPESEDSKYERYGSDFPIIFGKGVKFLPANLVREHDCWTTPKDSAKIQAGSEDNFWAFLRKDKITKVDVYAKKQLSETELEVKVDKSDFSKSTDVAGTTVKMAALLEIHAKDALYMVKQAQETGKVSFLVIDSDGFTKKSTSIRIVNSPDFQTDYDSDLNVAQDTTQQVVLNTEVNQPVPPIRRLGDAYDPSLGHKDRTSSKDAQDKGITDEMLFNKSPEEIAQLSKDNKVSNLIEHGVVGMLLSTYDSAALINRYIPKLEEGLDHFGRLIFLFHWKPTDFENLYGSDDMNNLENNLVSQFKSFGDILLDIIKKNETARQGSAPL